MGWRDWRDVREAEVIRRQSGRQSWSQAWRQSGRNVGRQTRIQEDRQADRSSVRKAGRLFSPANAGMAKIPAKVVRACWVVFFNTISATVILHCRIVVKKVSILIPLVAFLKMSYLLSAIEAIHEEGWSLGWNKIASFQNFNLCPCFCNFCGFWQIPGSRQEQIQTGFKVCWVDCVLAPVPSNLNVEGSSPTFFTTIFDIILLSAHFVLNFSWSNVLWKNHCHIDRKMCLDSLEKWELP